MRSKGLMTLAFCLAAAVSHAVTVGDRAPPWRGLDLVSGSEVDFPAVRSDGPAVLVFWATWCPYCKAFMPYVKQIQADYARHNVQIITFNAKERGRGDPKAYVDSLAFPLIAIANADAIAERYDIPFIPGLLVVGADGVIAYRRRTTSLPAGKSVSQQWSEEVRAVLNELLADTSAGRGSDGLSTRGPVIELDE